MPVLAACLANQQPGSWAGAFRLREGFAVIVVRDDLIVPDGDQFLADETEARDRLLQEVGFGGLQRIYAPESWGVTNSDSMPISLLLNDKTDVRLRYIRIPKKVVVSIGAVLAVLLLVLAGGWYYQDMKEREEQEQQARIAAMQKAQDAARRMVPDLLQGQPITYPEPERTWEKKAKALDLIEACRASLVKVPLTVSGWALTSIRCDGSSLSANWARTNGFTKPPDSFNLAETGSSATMSIPITGLEPRGAENLINVADVTRRIMAQNWPANVARATPDPLPKPPPGYKGTWEPPQPPWIKRSFTLNAPVLPWYTATFFSDFPGLVVNGLSYTPSGIAGTWSIEGVIYENRR